MSILILLFVYLFSSSYIPNIETNGLAVCALAVLFIGVYFIDRRYPERIEVDPSLVEMDVKLKKVQMDLAIHKTEAEYAKQASLVGNSAPKNVMRF